MRLIDLVAVALAAKLAATPASAEDMSAGNAPNPTIAVLGRGAVLAEMDTALVSVVVTAEATFAQDAAQADRAKVKRLTAALRDAGVFEADINISALRIVPRFAAPGVSVSASAAPGAILDPVAAQMPQLARPMPTATNGFVASTTLRFKTHNLPDIGILVDRIAENDDNRVPTIIYVLENPQKTFEEARRQAFDNAEHIARLEAERAHLKLVSVQSVIDEPLRSTGNQAPQLPAPVNLNGQSQSFIANIEVRWNAEPQP
jgi:uncharacterized protein YggE